MDVKNIYFGNDRENVYTRMRDYINHYSSEVKGKNRGEYDKSKSLEEKNKQLHEQYSAEVEKVSGVNFNDYKGNEKALAMHPMVQYAAGAIMDTMIDAVIPDVLTKDTGLYADVITGDFGSSYSFDVKSNDLFVVSKAGRNQRNVEMQRDFEGTVTIVPENREITIGTNLYRQLCGLDSFAEPTMKAILSLENQLRLEAYNLLNATMTGLETSPEGGSLKVAGFTKDTAIALAQRVSAFNNAKAMFVGTNGALACMMPDDASFRYDENSELFKLGHFRNFAGYDLYAMDQVAKWDDKYKLALDDKKIFVISPSAQKFIKICYEGSQLTNLMEAYKYANNKQTLTLNKAWGMGIATNAVGGLIQIS